MSTRLIVPSRPRTLRRLSSETVTSSDLSTRNPTVVAPEALLEQPSDAHEVAAAIEVARHELDENETPSSETPPETTITDKYAFAFDIDGVLIRGGRPIPEAIEAMKMLNGQNAYGIKVSVRCY